MKHFRRYYWTMLLLGMAFPAMPLQGGIVFNDRILELRTMPSEHSVEGTFVFQNTGDQPVTIRRIKTGCGCTTARLEKQRIEPGEQGQIVANFRYGFEKGLLRKGITVFTDDPAAPEIPLEIRVLVAPAVEVSPTLVYWRVGEPVTTKTVQVTFDPKIPTVIRETRTNGSDFHVSLEKDGNHGGYQLKITPGSTSSRAAAKIELETSSTGRKPETYRIFARVK
jgi:hypothetical protein